MSTVAVSAMGSAVGVPTRDSAAKMRLPSPGPLTYAAIARMPIDICVEIRIPARMDGHASGSSTRASTPIRLIPTPRAASTVAAGTASRPTIVLRRIGNTA